MFNELASGICKRILSGEPCEYIAGDVANFEIAYQIQDVVAEQLAPIFGGIAGYKIAWNTPKQIADLAPNAPAVGHVFGDFVFESDKNFMATTLKQLVVEPEIIARIQTDMDEDSYNSSSALKCISEFHVGFEIMERRNTKADVLAHPPTIVANNVFNRGLILGGSKPADQFDYQAMTTIAHLNGIEFVNKLNAAPQNPALAVSIVANNLRSRGKFLKSGDLVLCGTHFPPFEVVAGSELSVQMGALGSAEFSYS